MGELLLSEKKGTKTYLVENTRWGPAVIRKDLTTSYPSEKQVRQFYHEFKLLQELDFPGIRLPIEVEKRENGQSAYFHYFEGFSLKKLLANDRVNLPLAINSGIFLAKTLALLHDQKVIHKNITANSVLYNPDTDKFCLIDFSNASTIKEKKYLLGGTGVINGDLNYIAPEQTGRINRQVDHRADLYSMGVLLYELLTGVVPFSFQDDRETVYGHIAVIPEPPATRNNSVPKILSDMVMKLLEKDADARYQSALGLQKDLERINKNLASGDLDDFEIGEYDKAVTLTISQKLYGREDEIAELSTHLEEVAAGGFGVDMVYGYSGSGKSSLVHEAFKTLAKTNGYFLSGKFDQLQRNIPYYAIRQALNDFITILLTEKEDHIGAVKEKILAALGEEAALMTEVIPELEQIIGEQPKVLEVSGSASQNRFNYVFNNFLRAITSKEQPIVLFIDDLQWADLASINLLGNIIRDTQHQYLLVIGSFRENEVSDAHPLAQMMKNAEKDNNIIRHIKIGNISNADITHLLADSFSLPAEEVLSLAKRLFLHTDGNAFYTIQIIQNLFEQDYLYFDPKKQRWYWDDKEIGKMAIPDNIVALMVQRIERLDKSTQELLMKGSCFGNSFQASELELVLKSPLEKFEDSLIAAQEEGFIIEDQEVYQFLHDRVQQAVYSLIPPQDQKSLHFEIGLSLQDRYASNDEKIFEIVDQLNFGIDLITDKNQRLDYAHLNLKAGKLAISSTAYDAALGYLKTGLIFIDNNWQQHSELVLELHTNAAEASYLIGDYAAVDTHIIEVLAHTTELLDKIRVYKLQSVSFKSQNNLFAAVEKGLEVLAMLNVKLPYKPNKAEVFSKLIGTRLKIAGKSPESLLELKKMSDPYMLAAMQVLVSIGPAIYWASPNLTPLTIFKMLLISVKYGNTDESTFAYSTFGLLLCGVTGEIKLGNRFGELALALSQKVNPINKVKGVFNVYCFVHHWSNPLSDSFIPFKETHLLGQSAGDLEFGALSAYLYCNHSFYFGTPLQELDHEFKIYSEEIRRIKQYTPLNYTLLHWQTILNLKNDISNPVMLSGPVYDEGEMLEKHIAANDKTALFKYHLLKMMLNYLFGNVVDAGKHATQGEELIDAVTGMYVTVAYYFYSGLVNAALYESEVGLGNKKRAKAKLKNSITKFSKWAKHSPVNNLQKFKLLQAELARINGNNQLAEGYYKEAIESAKQSGLSNDIALIYELAGRHYLDKEESDLAQFYFSNAFIHYQQWGAASKCKELKHRYRLDKYLESFLKSVNISYSANDEQNSLEKLDINTITEAAESISDEIQFDQLKAKLLNILAENAGAEKAILFLVKGEFISQENAWPENREEPQEYPASLIDVVLKDKEILVTDRALEDSRFNADTYITSNSVRSALCLPLVHQHDLIAIIYLENNVIHGAFSKSRIEFLSLLSGQIAIAIKNAALYQNLTESYDQQVQLKDAYSKFVPMDFLEFLGKDSILDITLGDQIQEVVTVMFFDIVDYTSLSENMTPKENFDFINGTLRRIGPALRTHNGVISQFMGDGAMAIFKDEPDNALLAAIEMHKSLQNYNKERQRKKRRQIQIGVGIHTGKVMLGILGEKMRMDQNVISDAVNIASRVQDLTRTYGANIMLTATSKAALKDPQLFTIRNLGETNIKGRKKSLEIFECLDGLEPEQTELKKESLALFEHAVSLYYEEKYSLAIDELERVLENNNQDKAIHLFKSWSLEALENAEIEK